MKDTLTSRQNPTVKRICSLADKKNRRREGLFRLDGIKLLEEAIEAGLELVHVAVRMPAREQIAERLETWLRDGLLSEEAYLPVSEAVFDKMTEEKSPEGVLCVARLPELLHQTAEGDFSAYGFSGERLLVLESVRDPGNLGTILRSAYALGIDRLILTDDCADLYHPRTVRAAMGALFRLPTLTVGQTDLPRYLTRLREDGRRLYGTALHTDAQAVGQIALRRGDGFVIGNEGHGLSPSVIEACFGCAVIPMREGAESLNAAAAAAICIWETVKACETEREVRE